MKKLLIFALIFVLGLMSVNAYNYNFISNYTSSNYCYQESTNESNQMGTDGNCYLNYTGKYYFGNISNSFLYLNYSKPLGSNSSLWQVSHGYTHFGIGGYIPYNISLPLSCFNIQPIQLRIFSSTNNGGHSNSYPQCYNNSNWILIGDNYTGIGHSGGASSDSGYNMVDGEWITTAEFNTAYNKWTSDFIVDSTSGITEEAMYWIGNLYYNHSINYSFISSSGVFGESSDVILNLTKGSNQSYSQATLIYNGVSYSGVSADYGSYVLFDVSKLNSAINNFSYYWNVSLIDYGNVFNFSTVNGSHVVSGNNVSFSIYNINTSILLAQNVSITMVGQSGSYYKFVTSNGTFFNDSIKSDSYVITFATSGFSNVVLNKVVSGGSGNVSVYFNGNVQNYLVIVQDITSLKGVANATVTLSQNVNGNVVVYSQLITDYSGSASFYLDSTVTYSMVVIAGGYDVFTGYFTPSTATNYVRLTQKGSSFKSVFDDVYYQTSTSNDGSLITFRMVINSLSSSLKYFYVDTVYLGVDELDYHVASTGGVASVTFPFNDSQTQFNVSYAFGSSLGNYSTMISYYISSASINASVEANSTSNGTLSTGMFGGIQNTSNQSITKGFFGIFLIMALAVFGLKFADNNVSAGLFMGGVGIGVCMGFALLPLTFCWIGLGVIGIILMSKNMEFV
ncbi:MAG TPA: hypothetical protein VMQ58_01965 [Candidatus Saccharimonadales bacterium]|nr:hypothetical protein [Candidatus Saccharimonadales bacterium]